MSPYELIVDSFAGGGGASLGIHMALGRHPDIAINHDEEAIALHAANHADSKHYAEDVWKVDPREACGSRPVGLMWLSPDCKHFSKAKGGKPVSKRVRGLAWVAIRWAKAVAPRVIVLENVEEFQTWGPVLRDSNRPCPRRKGQTFRAFVRRLEQLGYAVQWRELRACDYGAPTIRRRLFLIARRDGLPIIWPVPTHGSGHPHPWRTAAECVEWAIPCPSIFTRKKPLAENTQRRIARGIQRFVLDNPRPFIVANMNNNVPRSVDEPMATVTGGNRNYLTTPYITRVAHGEQDAKGKRRGKGEHDLQLPLPTILGTQEFGLVAPIMQARHGEWPEHPARAKRLDEPMPTIDATQNSTQLIAAFLAKHNGGHEATGQKLEMPMHSIVGRDQKALVTSHLAHLRGTEPSHLHGDPVDAPLRTVSAGGYHAAEVRSFLIQYYSQGSGKEPRDLNAPAPTVTSRDRLGLVSVHGVEYVIADIGMRMLVPRELYRAQGFPDSYNIDIAYRGKPLSKTAQVRMVGNSVCPPLAAAIVAANVGSETEARVA